MISINKLTVTEAADEFYGKMLEARTHLLEIAEMKDQSIENTIALVAMEYAETYLKELKRDK